MTNIVIPSKTTEISQKRPHNVRKTAFFIEKLTIFIAKLRFSSKNLDFHRKTYDFLLKTNDFWSFRSRPVPVPYPGSVGSLRGPIWGPRGEKDAIENHRSGQKNT